MYQRLQRPFIFTLNLIEMSIAILIKIFQILFVVAAIPAALFIKHRDLEIYAFLHNEKIDIPLNIISTYFMAKLFVIKICGQTWTIHSIFEQVFFYGGGFITLFWGAFNIKLKLLDIAIKKLDKKLKEKELKK